MRTLPTMAVTMPIKEFHCSLPYGGIKLVDVGLGASLVAVAGPAATVVGGNIMAVRGDSRVARSLSAVYTRRGLVGKRSLRRMGVI